MRQKLRTFRPMFKHIIPLSQQMYYNCSKGVIGKLFINNIMLRNIGNQTFSNTKSFSNSNREYQRLQYLLKIFKLNVTSLTVNYSLNIFIIGYHLRM